ncbi:hypothetical protein PybrP1_001730 [[Pythium] brassicae (nom. inval.)]|nr:hypothetical protein PybrP1_001730 [[Pythium] brassicae (nom. inval.)]
MPLFDSIESDVATFFVSQGSVFDALVKSFMDRVAHVEARVDALALDTNESFQSVSQQMQLLSAVADAHAAATLAQLEQVSRIAAADRNSESSVTASTLHVVLELFFQPHGHDIVEDVQSKQARFESISDVLTQNEAILMQLSVASAPQQSEVLVGSIEPILEEHDGDASSDVATEVDDEVPDGESDMNLYDSFRDFHELQLSEAERERLREKEWLRKVQQMLVAAKKHWRDEEKMRELESHQMKLQSEWKYLQEQQRPHDLVLQQQQHQQQELDRRFAVLSESYLAAQHVQEQQLADVLESLRTFQNKYVSKTEFDSMASAWLQTARDESVFGVSADALAALKHEMEAFHTHLLSSQSTETSPLIEQLLSEVTRVLELLNQLLELLNSDDAGLHSANGFEIMQTLRTSLTGLDNLAQSLEGDRDESARSVAFVSETLRQMELGAANLLEVFETQQDNSREAFEQQQRAIAQLQLGLRDQRQADEELKRQLAGCPSQEDTMHVIQELRAQIDASASDSAARMLETVDELRARLGGLPSAEIVERLAQLIQKKADRAEMDRLEKLLAAANSGSVAPVGSLMKAPMKCLACDQSLLYMHISAGPPERDGAARHLQQHSCSHDHQQLAPKRSYYYAEPIIPTGEADAVGLKDLFGTSSTAAFRRRKQRQLQASASASSFAQNNWLDGAAHTRPSFVNLDDGRNRIPLRRTVLSDQVIYGPAITPNAFKRRAFASALSRFDYDPQSSSRPKTAVAPARWGGEIITRSVSSTVVIRPFVEQATQATASDKQRAGKH